jgi:hypothetical protein
MAFRMNLTPTPQSASTISDVEQVVQKGLEALRDAPLRADITEALRFLTPAGYRPVAQLVGEDGRKKRSTAAASNWSPETGEIVIYFEPLVATETKPVLNVSERSSPPPPLQPVSAFVRSRPMTPPPAHDIPDASGRIGSEDVTPLQVQQCCEALAEAEKAGKLFIAFKWFRDEELPRYKFDWTISQTLRQRVLAKAVEMGAIQTKPIPNPKSPQHPTTVVSLNRSEAPQTMPRRFNPIVVRGEPVSATIMRDRGSL